MTEEIKNYTLNPWHPMDKPVDIKVIGKFLEEMGEGVAASARCLIQGIEEKEPITGKVNKDWLEDEIADMHANLQLVIEHFHLDSSKILERSLAKKARLKNWHDML